MKTLTLNCNSCHEENQEENLNYLADVIANRKYDVICLQEVSQKISDTIVYDDIKKSNFAYRLCEALRIRNCDYDFVWAFNHIGYDKYEEGVAIVYLKTLEIEDKFQAFVGQTQDVNFWKTRKIARITVKNHDESIDFYSCHFGWWDDTEGSFQNQFNDLLKMSQARKNRCFFMGDFNNIAAIRGEGYDYVLANQIYDTYTLAENKDSGTTVLGVIAGWEEKSGDNTIHEKRIDYIFTNKKAAVKTSNVIFNGKNQKIISDHYAIEVEVDLNLDKKRNSMFERSSGLLMHISSLPSAYGIGDFGKKAYEFVNFLEESGQKLWQVLPMGPTGYGDSPYQSFSAFANNPYFIDLENLVEEGLLKSEDIEGLKELNDVNSIDYEMIYLKKMPILRKAYEKFSEMGRMAETVAFQKEQSYWLEDYGLYTGIKSKFNQASWQEWPSEYKSRDKAALEQAKTELKAEIEFCIFVQYILSKQWKKLKKYANDKGIKIIGDMPIFVASDSADTWSKSEMFQLDENRRPIRVAGCPPDGFSATGQLWGNPLYNWENLEKSNFSWWIERLKSSFELYDIARIDHFRGFESYWSIPSDAATAATGRWEKGPGMKLFNAIKKALGELPIIAEDLGFLTPEVVQLLKDSTFPGMKVLLFAFDSKEESDYLPHKYSENSVAYTGTHDNETVVGWYHSVKAEDKWQCDEYFSKMGNTKYNSINWNFLDSVWGSRSVLAIAQVQDLIGLGNEGRMNTPSTSGINWKWRLKDQALTKDMAKQLKELTQNHHR